jgi:hypothetical protein
MTLQVGEERTIALPGLGSAGYTWVWDVEGPQDCISVRLDSAAPSSPSEGAVPQGGSIDSLLVVTARHPCSLTIRLAQRRPWEKNRPPLREQTIAVTVTAS